MHQVLLIICDGWGIRKESKYNAIAQAHTPNYHYLIKYGAFTTLQASGEAIGLPEGQIGTSEANHLILGSGRIVYQNLLKINHAIKNKSFFENKALKEAFAHVKKYKSTLHIKGVVSPGGVHGHTNHIKALILFAKQYGIQNVMLHLFTDGRDVLPMSAIEYVKDIESFCASIGVGRIASIGGRFWGMDRDNNKERIEKHFKVMVVGEGPRFKNPIEVITQSYKKNVTDEFIEPAIIETDSGEIGCIQPNDAVIFANFRSDRTKQLTQRFLDHNIPNLKYVSMTKYADNFDIRMAFPPEMITNTLSQIISSHGMKQLRITETEKFTHLTFFFNAQKYEADLGEERIIIPTNKDISTHDKKPEMKAQEIAHEVVKAIQQQKYNFICINLVNADIVGHTGDFQAITKGVEAVDTAIGTILTTAKQHEVDIILTADHGNAEETYDESTQQPITAHTCNPVPFILFTKTQKKINHQNGLLSDVAPTILKLLNLPIPKEMTGKSFI